MIDLGKKHSKDKEMSINEESKLRKENLAL